MTSPSPDIPAIWQAANQAQAEAQQHYPAMACHTGCNDCCKHAGSPITYASEWAVIEPWLAAHPQVLDAIAERYRALKRSLQARLHQPEVPSLLEALFEVACPCIEPTDAGERCSIYPVRPLTCRCFGNSLIKRTTETIDEIYTCTPEKERWERDLPMLGELDLPLRGSLFAALEGQDSHRSLLSYLEHFFYRRQAQSASPAQVPHGSD